MAEALAVINHWRACHAYPINTFQATLRWRLRKVCTDPLVATRPERVNDFAPPMIKNLLRKAVVILG